MKLGRVQNFKNWSPDLVPDPSKTSLGLEYFCFEGDDVWTMPDADLSPWAAGRSTRSAWPRLPKSSTAAWCACPRLTRSTTTSTRTTWRSSAAGSDLSNLELAGRNGMHKYNNQDHSMMTALLAARNILGLGQFDTWNVNTDAEYHEGAAEDETAKRAGRAVPERIQA